MVRPRQRRKVKNPSTKVSRKRKNPNKISFEKVHPLVKQHWDHKLTMMQNYARLGLMGSLKGKAGGIGNEFYVKEEDTILGKRKRLREHWDVEDIDIVDASLANEALKLGAVSVLREDGQEELVSTSIDNQQDGAMTSSTNINNDDDEEEEEEYLPENNVKVDARTVAVGRRPGHIKDMAVNLPSSVIRSSFLQALEEEASKKVKTIRDVSEQEMRILLSLFKKHQMNLDDMARDMKLNKFQLSAGQLKRKFKNLSHGFGLDLEF